MSVIADTHVHIYPCYDTARFLQSACRNLGALRSSAEEDMLLCLTERSDCGCFRSMRDKGVGVPGWNVSVGPEPWSVCLEHDDMRLHVVAGRQIVTRERLEVLALAVDAEFVDGLPIVDAIDAVLEARGVPVVSWAPGKWLGKRGAIVSGLLDKYETSPLLLGDTSLRPTVWAEPRIMREARGRGFRVLAGSDPLPFAGEEAQVGTYGIRLESGDTADPVLAFRAALAGDGAWALVGRRGGPFSTFRRLLTHHRRGA